MNNCQLAFMMGYMSKEAQWDANSLRKWMVNTYGANAAARYRDAQLGYIAAKWNKDWFSQFRQAFGKEQQIPYGGAALGGLAGAGIGGLAGGLKGALITGGIGAALGGLAQRFGVGVPQLMDMLQKAYRGYQLRANEAPTPAPASAPAPAAAPASAPAFTVRGGTARRSPQGFEEPELEE